MECPAGYILVRGETNYDDDECVRCEITTYSLDIASFYPGPGEPALVESTAAAALARCLPCPDGGICQGGNDVMNTEDWWRNEFPEKEIKDPTYANMTLFRVFACKPGYCKENSTCLNGSTGVLCSLCLPNHAMSGGVCTVCTSDDADDGIAKMRVTVLTGLGIVGFLIWIVLCCRMLLPAVQSTVAKVVGFFAAMVTSTTNRIGAAEDAAGTVEIVVDCLATVRETFETFLPAELFDSAMAPQMMKIVVSFYQVVSSFFNFNVKWPDLMTKIILMAENVNLSILTIPGEP